MTLTLVPKGRGRWKPMTMRIENERGGLLIRAGQILLLGGVLWRIVKVAA